MGAAVGAGVDVSGGAVPPQPGRTISRAKIKLNSNPQAGLCMLPALLSRTSLCSCIAGLPSIMAGLAEWILAANLPGQLIPGTTLAPSWAAPSSPAVLSRVGVETQGSSRLQH